MDVYQNDEIVIESHGNTASLAYIREEILVNGDDHLNGSDSSFHKSHTEVIEEAFSVDDTSLSSIEFVDDDFGIVDVRSDLPWKESLVLYSGRESGRYPSKPDMVLSEDRVRCSPISVSKKSMVFASQFDSLRDDGLN